MIFREDYGKGEPTDVMAEAIWKDVPKDAKRVVSVGGGSILDLSKLFALENISPVTDLYDGLLPIVKNKELVLVPTTCGTGSEVTNISILSLTAKGTKKGLAVEQLYGDSAVLIPELLEDLPFQFLLRVLLMRWCILWSPVFLLRGMRLQGCLGIRRSR